MRKLQCAFFIHDSLNMGAVAPSTLTTTQAVAPGMFRSPLDDAYYYYGMQNPLDSGVGAGKPVIKLYHVMGTG
jgi:hypothetical protein